MYSIVVRALSLALAAAGVLAAPPTNPPTLVNLRIEGLDHTIYEAPILTYGHNITTPSGGTHHCDGTNLNANPKPGPTCTSALDNASKLWKFPYDGTYSQSFDDYFITSIGDSAQTDTQFWGLLLNYQFTLVGGCQQQVKVGDYVLWAFNAFNKDYFLKLESSGATRVGKPYTFTVTDGPSGATVAGATVASLDGGASTMTGADGKATLTFAKPGLVRLKAEHPSAIRSNRVEVLVL